MLMLNSGNVMECRCLIYRMQQNVMECRHPIHRMLRNGEPETTDCYEMIYKTDSGNHI